MEAISLVFKAFLLTALTVAFMQMKIGQRTIEERSVTFLTTSPAAKHMQSAAAGGAKALKDFGVYLRERAQQHFSDSSNKPHEKAVR